MFRNKYRGVCKHCGGEVPANSGYTSKMGGSWVTWCILHKDEGEKADPYLAARAARASQPSQVIVSVHQGLLDFQLVGGMVGREKFLEFKAAVDENGGRAAQINGKWHNLVPVTSAGAAIEALKQAGFDTAATEEAKALLRGAVQQLAADEASLQARLTHPNASRLRNYQRVGVQWLASRPGGVIGDEMGTGKTIQTLMAIGEKKPVVVVVPASLKLNWQKEARKWRPEYEVSVLQGRESFRWPKPGEIVITNYQILPKVDDASKAKLDRDAPPFAVLVADEAHNIKEKTTAQTKRFTELSRIVRKKNGNVWLLTGTPLLNRPMELWNVLSAAGVEREAFTSFDRFKELFNAEQGRHGLEWGRPEKEVPELLRRVMLRREKKDVLADLPAKTVQSVLLESSLTTTQNDELRRVLELINEAVSSRGGVLAEEEAAIPKFPGFEQFSKALTVLAKAKTKPTIAYIEQFIEESKPFLVFADHIEPLRDVMAAVRDAGKRCEMISGDTPNADRQRFVDAFQAGELDALVLSIRAAGVGLTLTRATDSVFIDLSVVPALNAQAEDRIHRIGQTQAVTIHRMVLDHPLDERIQELIADKMALMSSTVGAASVRPDDVVTIVRPATSSVAAALDVLESTSIIQPLPAAPPPPPPKFVQFQIRDRTVKRVVPTAIRPAKTRQEEWAAEAVLALTGMDSDRAKEKNEMGWGAGDTGDGHYLAALLSTHGGLTDIQWVAAIEMCKKYWRQVGRCPRDRDTEEAVTNAITEARAEAAPPVPANVVPDQEPAPRQGTVPALRAPEPESQVVAAQIARPMAVPVQSQHIGTPGEWVEGIVQVVYMAQEGEMVTLGLATRKGARLVLVADTDAIEWRHDVQPLRVGARASVQVLVSRHTNGKFDGRKAKCTILSQLNHLSAATDDGFDY